MRNFLFKVMVVTGASFTISGSGYSADSALMDACDALAQEYDEDAVVDIELIGENN